MDADKVKLYKYSQHIGKYALVS